MQNRKTFQEYNLMKNISFKINDIYDQANLVNFLFFPGVPLQCTLVLSVNNLNIVSVSLPASRNIYSRSFLETCVFWQNPDSRSINGQELSAVNT